MHAEYKRDMNHNYLVIHAEQEIDTASYQVRMLVGNSIPSLLKCRVQGMDGSFMIYYEITSKQSLSSLFEEKKLRYQDLQLVFGGFMHMLEEMSEYLLNPGRLVLHPEYLFVDAEKQKLYFCYRPDFEKDVHRQFQELTEYLLPRLDHEDQKAVMLGYGVYRRAMEDSFRLEYIKEELYRECEGNPCGEPGEDSLGEMHAGGGEDFSGKFSGGSVTPNGQEKEADFEWKAEDDLFALRDGEPGKVKKEQAGREGPPFWKRFLGCLTGAFLALGVLLAELLGYLPGIELPTILGGVLALAGIGILIYAVFKKETRTAWTASGSPQSVRKKERKAAEGKRDTGSLWSVDDLRPEGAAEQEYLKEDICKENRKKTEKDCDNSENESYKKGIRMEQDAEEGSAKANFGETVVLSAGALKGPATLVSREPGELASIYLQGELTVIGKLENAADAVIDLPTVSRIHAKIRFRDGDYYLTDLNSRNGTSVNGRMLLPDQDYCLRDQDQVDFAQARYVFLSREPS